MDYFKISEEDYYKIMSCVKQHIIKCHENNFRFDEFFVISVWYPDMANLYLKSETKSNEFAVLNKFDYNYNDVNNINKAHKIWNNNLIPVEIMKDNQGFFFCFPKSNIESFDFEIWKLLPAEYSIPKVSDFYS